MKRVVRIGGGKGAATCATRRQLDTFYAFCARSPDALGVGEAGWHWGGTLKAEAWGVTTNASVTLHAKAAAAMNAADLDMAGLSVLLGAVLVPGILWGALGGGPLPAREMATLSVENWLASDHANKPGLAVNLPTGDAACRRDGTHPCPKMPTNSYFVPQNSRMLLCHDHVTNLEIIE